MTIHIRIPVAPVAIAVAAWLAIGLVVYAVARLGPPRWLGFPDYADAPVSLRAIPCWPVAVWVAWDAWRQRTHSRKECP